MLHELKVKRVQFNDALVQALGLRVGRGWRGQLVLGGVTPVALLMWQKW